MGEGRCAQINQLIIVLNFFSAAKQWAKGHTNWGVWCKVVISPKVCVLF